MKTALVTGGTSGIGKGMALSYVEKGYHVFAVGTSEQNGKALLEEANKISCGKLELNKIAARWPAKAVAQFFYFFKKGSDRIVPR